MAGAPSTFEPVSSRHAPPGRDVRARRAGGLVVLGGFLLGTALAVGGGAPRGAAHAAVELLLGGAARNAPVPPPGAGLRLSEVFVDCDPRVGSDRYGDGTAARPFLSPMRARDEVRARRPAARDPIRVTVSGDCLPRHPATAAVDFNFPVLELVAALDSGSRAAPISWVGRGARLLSGLPVPHQAWRRWSGPSPWLDNIVVANVLELGVESKFMGGFLRPDNPGGNKMGRCTSYQMELFFGGEPMTIARYPNVGAEGKSQWLHVDTVLDPQHAFQVQDERLLAWRAEPDAWLHGYWSYDWADSYVRVTDVDSNATSGAVRLRVEEPVLYGVSEGAKFYGVNILSELDTPGEYYIDRQTGDLYFWPPGELQGTEVFLSVGDYTVVMGTTAAVVREAALASEVPDPAAAQSLAAVREHAGAAFAMRAEMLQDRSAFQHDLDEEMSGDASNTARAKTPASVWLGDFDFWNGRRVAQRREMASADGSGGQARLERVALENFGIHYARVSGVVVAAAQNVQLQDLVVSNIGQVGVDMDGEYLHVNRVEVAHTGCGAMSLNGGDSFCLGSDPEYCSEQGSTLRRSHNVVEHSVLHRFARVCRTYTPGLAFTGCGHTFRHNVVRDAPHSGVIGGGNDCVFADNAFRHLAFEATDSGALMMGRSWVRRGHQIVRNRFEHIKNTEGMVLGYAQVMGIYLDDMQSGVTIVGNHFVDCHVGVYVGGGRDVTVSRNTFREI